MLERSNKEWKNVEISLGLLVGYLIGGFVNMMAFDKSWQEAYSNEKLLMGIAGIAFSIFIILNLKKKQKQKN